MSDLHGCYKKYIKMLERIKFSDNDTMYILGDIVDRGKDGIKILSDLMNRKNVVVLRGNHDFVAYTLLSAYLYKDMSEIKKNANDYLLWLTDGGKPTYDSFKELSKDDQIRVLDYLKTFPVYDEIEVENNNFFLSHTVPPKEKMLDFESCKWQDFVLGEPEYDKCYFDDKYIVTGHIPTGFISVSHKGKIYIANNHIAIDCGAVFGNTLGCICLDNFEEFYV